ncbi:helix-turn-helix domain-containing protein [Micromonospora carbonacea]|uniref:helix-turn-helix domain-containing protein n=1 Tax=Micromonospora carbonacea TaxID=47853 RepID=UPI003D7171CD
MTDLRGTELSSNVEHSWRHGVWCPAHQQREVDLSAVLPGLIASALLLVPSLTARETATLRLLGAGYDNHTIARRLSVSERTVKRHVSAVLGKLGLTSRLQAGLVSMVTTLVGTEGICRGARPFCVPAAGE